MLQHANRIRHQLGSTFIAVFVEVEQCESDRREGHGHAADSGHRRRSRRLTRNPSARQGPGGEP